MSTSKRDLSERFWEKVDNGADDECWEWTGATTSGGYGVIRVDGALQYVHRLPFLHDEDPNDGQVNHHCDNPSCVNPRHLYVGDQSQNMQDALSRGRFGVGEEVSEKLSEEDVTEIRQREPDENQYDLADEFGVDQSLISRIANAERWEYTGHE